MTARKASLTGFAGILSLALVTTAACGLAEETTKEESPKVSVATPRDTLLAAVPDTKVGAYKFDIKGGETPMSGVLDAPKKTIELKIVHKEPDVGLTMTMTSLVVDKQGWMKIAFTPANLPGLPKLPKKWVLLDPAKVKDAANSPLEYSDETDPGYVSLLVQNSADLKETSPGHFAGTTDLTQSTDADIVDDKTLTALGEKAKTVPFTAVIDAEGHITSAVVKIPAAGKTKASAYQVTYSAFGKTATPSAPAGNEQTPATAAVYELLNG
ncbi:MAG: hypothetical protein ABW022_23800 [Actinoplanes sp.]